MISPNDFRTDDNSIYQSTPSPILSDVKQLNGIPKEKYYSLYENGSFGKTNNFIPSYINNFNDQRMKYPVVMSASGNGIEGFGESNTINFFIRLIIFALVIALIYYLIKKY